MGTPSSIGSASVLSAALVGMVACGLDWTVPPSQGSGGTGDAATTGVTSSSGGGGGVTVASTGGSTGFAAGGSPSGGGAGGGGGTGGGGSATTSSTGTGQSMCDMGATCVACDNCAIDRGCHAAYKACDSDFSCYNLGSCVYNDCERLGDVLCIDDCYNFYPLGADLFDAFAVCIVCDECDASCSAYQQWWGCQ